MRRVAAFVLVALTGCAGSGQVSTRDRLAARTVHRLRAGSAHAPVTEAPPLQALVTAQTENQLLVVSLPGGQLVRRVRVAGDPTYVAAAGSVVVVVSSASATVTLLDRRSLRVIKLFDGLSSPHIAAISPDDRYAYVTDDASGTLDVIGLYDEKLIARVRVGAGAHHLAFSPDEQQAWVALGQAAGTITILSAVVRGSPAPNSPVIDAGHPHVVGHLHPGFLAHDLRFSSGGKAVWITSADSSYVGVFSASTRRLRFRVAAGPPPQHLVFANGYAYITSGYGSSIEQVDPYSGRVVRKVYAPYGSFDLDAAGRYVVAASLLRGTLAIYDRNLRLLRVARLAPSTEDVALSVP